MKAQKGSRGVTILFLEPRPEMEVGSEYKSSAALTRGMNRYPFYRMLDRVQGQSRHTILLYDLTVRHETSCPQYYFLLPSRRKRQSSL